MRTNIKIVILATMGTLFLSACGGGNSTANNGINIEMCSTNNTTVLRKGDKVTASTDDTEIRVSHKEDGTKEACVVTGNAKIVSLN